ncbi:MAG: hypothetical protein IKC49_03145 [Clostridia bacterium]|nr:hypothetical protein [Clostridia bacterium]
MEHHFNINVAERYGINCAVLLQNIYFWVEKNKANQDNNNYFDGYYWTHNSAKAFAKYFSYMTERQIRYALEKLQSEGLILVRNYSDKCDRTLWYTITQKALNLLFNKEETIEEPIIELEDIEEPASCQQVTSKLEDQEVKPQEESQDQVTKLSNGNDKIVNSKLQNCQMEVTNLSNDTNKIPQIKNTNINIYQEKETHKEKERQCVFIFEHWNSLDLMKCSELDANLKAVILQALKSFTLEQIKLYISRYAEILKSKFYYQYPWNLAKFLRKGIQDFTDTGDRWNEYKYWLKNTTSKDKPSDKFIHNNYSQEQIDSMITDLDKVEP